MSDQIKYTLSESEMPTAWYNIAVHLPVPPPPLLNPLTKEPVTPEFLNALFPMGCILQAVSKDEYIDIPGEILDIYRQWRPSPLFRARKLEKFLDTPARIYYKYEGVSPVGSHKPNTAIAQAYYAKQEGVKKLTTETGAGQWGSALAMACSYFDLECQVFMVKVSYYQKPYRRSVMGVFGASVAPSPSELTEAGRRILAADPDTPGSLGMAISEAVEVALKEQDAMYSLGSVVDFVLLHQTVIGEEALLQLEKAGETGADIVIGCVGGGSNFAGLAFPFIRGRLTEGKDTQMIAVEPTACPTMTRGKYAFDYGDTAKMAPIAKMHTLGHSFVPPGIHAGGLRYHGMAPLVSMLAELGHIEARACHQTGVFKAAIDFARTEGIIVAPETAHAVKVTIDEALKAKEAGEEKVIIFNLSGHGLLDLSAYDNYLADQLADYEYPQEAINKALEELPEIPEMALAD
ncbi:MAG: TrpB-like pyridoxal phosphate-dependent enzyme [Anaerolineae bacterium]|nr:TrpB-like pyridoxal phosphate-dependent enzyme [Anaerolineae bacterium]